MMDAEHKTWMEEAIALSRRNIQGNNGGPFAALIVKDRKIIARGTNLVTSANDPTAHAEIIAIRDACRTIQSFRLDGCEIITTCEPCPMCLGAIYWARLEKIYFANTREDAAWIGFDDSAIYEEVSSPLSRRRIPTIQLMQEQALVVFQEWEQKENRIRY